MRFQPKSDKEIAEERLIPEGKYGFVISDAKEATSKAGNDMIALTLRVYKDDGNFLLVNDYLMESMAFKLKHCAEACDLLADYESGSLNADDFVGKEGYAKIKIQKDKTGNYPDKNVVADYIVDKESKGFKAPQDNLSKALDGVKKDEFEDDIPF